MAGSEGAREGKGVKRRTAITEGASRLAAFASSWLDFSPVTNWTKMSKMKNVSNTASKCTVGTGLHAESRKWNAIVYGVNAAV